MKKYVTSVPIALSLMASLAACQKRSNKNPIENAREAISDVDLQSKSFLGDCSINLGDALASFVASSGKYSVKSSRDQFQFVGANLTRTTRIYESADCTGQDVLMFKETGAFHVDPDKRAEDQSNFIDITYDRLTLVAQSEFGVQLANEIKICGHEDWSVGKEIEVTAQAEDVSCYRKKLPSQEADVYRLENNNLYFGERDALLKSRQSRPARVDLKTKYSAK
jgi:hypothetical protein